MSIVEMRVEMDCHGCARKIRKALSKLRGVNEVDIDVNLQKVTVTGWADQEKVLKTVRKTGQNAELWPLPYNPEYHDYTYFYGQNYGSSDNNYYSGQPIVNYSPTDYYTAEQSSTYNYHKNGYHRPPSSAILDDQTITMFSDDNATGCTIM